MKPRNELYRTKEYWMESIQNDLYFHLATYMKENGLNKADLAKEFGVSRAYITQILNGEFNFSLKKLVELSLAIGMVPRLHFQSIAKYEKEKEAQLVQSQSEESMVMVMEETEKYSKTKK